MKIKEILKDNNKKHIIIVLLTTIYNYVWGFLKIILGIFATGLLYTLSGLDTIFVAISKHIYLKNISKRRKHTPLVIASFIVLIGLLYTLYAVRLFFMEDEIKEYSLILAITIALFSFIELGIAINNLFIKERKDLLNLSFRSLSFSLALFAINNTQNALLMALGKPNNFADGIFGVISGSITILLGIFVLIKTLLFLHKKKIDENNAVL